MIGTPNYMAPEQARGDLAKVGPSADIYSLGAILYELLAGQVPFNAPSPLEILRRVHEEEPTPPRWLNPAVPHDLETICLKCLQKEPERRYATAGELADDLRRFLAHEPILARPIGLAERATRWARRNPSLALAFAAIAWLVLLTLAGTAWHFRNLAGERETARIAAEQQATEARWRQYQANLAAAMSALQLNNTEGLRRAVNDAPEEYRGWEWRHCQAQLDGARRSLPTGHRLNQVLLSADGRQVVCANQDGITLWHVATGAQLDRIERTRPATPAAALRPDGARLAFGCIDGELLEYDLAARQTRPVPLPGVPARAEPWIPCYAPDGSRLAVARMSDGQVAVTDPAGGAPTVFALPAPVEAHTYTPDGRYLLVPAGDFNIYVYSSDGRRKLRTLTGHSRLILHLVVSPDSRRLASLAEFPDHAPRLWDLEAGTEVVRLDGHENFVDALNFSPDGQRIVTASWDQTARIWDAASGRNRAVLRGHTQWVRRALFTPDSQQVVTAGNDGTIRLWDAVTGVAGPVLRGHASTIDDLSCDTAGRTLVSASWDGTLRLWDLEAARRQVLGRHDSFVYDVAISPDGTTAASVGWDGTARTWNLDTGAAGEVYRHPGSIVTGVSFSPTGDRLFTIVRDSPPDGPGLFVWGPGSQRASRPARAGSWLIDNNFLPSPDGQWLVSGGHDHVIRLWPAAGGPAEELRPVSAPNAERSAGYLTWSPRGNEFAAGLADGNVSVWNLAERREVAVLRGHKGVVQRVAYSPDGRWLASAGSDHVVRLWDAASRAEVHRLPHASVVYALAFHPTEPRLATGTADNAIHLWDLKRCEEVAELRGHTAYVHAVAFTPDGTRLISGSGDGTVRVWDTLSARERSP